MSANIHSSAVVDDGADIGVDVEIGPFCVVAKDARLEEGVVLHSHVVIGERTVVGSGTHIYPFAAIGLPPQDRKYSGEASRLRIGENNVIREHVTMNPGTEGGGMETVVGNDGLFMAGAHVAHDCRVGNHVIMANNATLAGHVEVGDHVGIGGLSGVHQFVRIGEHAFIGGKATVLDDVIPYGMVKGEKAFLAGLNLVGLERRGFDREQIRTLKAAVEQLFDGEGTLDDRLRKVEAEYPGDHHVSVLVDFVKQKTKFPLCRPKQKRSRGTAVS